MHPPNFVLLGITLLPLTTLAQWFACQRDIVLCFVATTLERQSPIADTLQPTLDRLSRPHNLGGFAPPNHDTLDLG